MNERRARHLLPRPCGLKPHPFTPPLLPRPPHASFLRSQQPRGAVPTHRHSCESRNPEGLCPGGAPLRSQQPRGAVPTPRRSCEPATQRGRPHACGESPALASNPEGPPPRFVIPAKPATQRRRARGGESLPSRDSRAEPAPHSDTGQEPRGARLELGRPSTDRLEMPAPSYRRSRTCWDLPSTACCSRRPHSCSRKR